VAEKEAGFRRGDRAAARGEPLIDPAADPRLTLCVCHNLIDWLTEAGRCLEAKA